MIRSRLLKSVRLHLTLWYTAAVVVVLALYASAVFTFVQSSLSRGLDVRLRAEFQWPAEMLDKLPDGTITPYDETDNSTSPWLQVYSPEGKLLYQTMLARLTPVPQGEELAARADGKIVSIPDATPPVRVLSGLARIGDQPVVIQVARSEAPMWQELKDLLLVLLLGLPLGVIAAGLGGFVLARRALAPVDRMAEHARLITAERLKDLLPVDNPDDELGRLATVFNETLTRLESSFERMRRFTLDASHELRTPLTAIRTVGEVGLRGRRDEIAYREIIGSMLEEADRLSQLVDRLLMLSRADSPQSNLSADNVNLCDLVRDVAAQLGVLAEEKQQSITLELAGNPRWTGDELVLRQAVLNLLDNAIKYTPAGGHIRVSLAETGAGVNVEVSDNGPGIPAELHSLIFDRFFRADEARTSGSGTGLGLSIAKWAVEVNGGQLTLEDSHGVGSTFRINLPQESLAAPAVSSFR